MSALSRILRDQQGNRLAFWCPGCNEAHAVCIDPGPWTYNGNPEKPTFSPSILVRGGHYSDLKKDACWCTYYKENPLAPGEKVFKCMRCHSFVRDGRIQFLDDCSHDLKGKTVDLPPWPGEEKEF